LLGIAEPTNRLPGLQVVKRYDQQTADQSSRPMGLADQNKKTATSGATGLKDKTEKGLSAGLAATQQNYASQCNRSLQPPHRSKAAGTALPNA
jgi:hypothetical protein